MLNLITLVLALVAAAANPRKSDGTPLSRDLVGPLRLLFHSIQALRSSFVPHYLRMSRSRLLSLRKRSATSGPKATPTPRLLGWRPAAPHARQRTVSTLRRVGGNPSRAAGSATSNSCISVRSRTSREHSAYPSLALPTSRPHAPPFLPSLTIHTAVPGVTALRPARSPTHLAAGRGRSTAAPSSGPRRAAPARRRPRLSRPAPPRYSYSLHASQKNQPAHTILARISWMKGKRGRAPGAAESCARR
jgi:hypothetical protein